MNDNEKPLKNAMYEALFGSEGSVSMKEFNRSFEAIVKQILQFEKKLLTQQVEASNELKSLFALLKKKIDINYKSEVVDLKQTTKESITKALNNLYAKLDSLEQPNDGKDGKDGVDGKDGKDGRQGKVGKDGSPDTGEEIIGKINKDKNVKINAEKVEGWKDIESMAKTAEANSRLGLRAGGDTVYLTDLSSQTNGVTKTFTIPVYRRAIMVTCSDFPTVLFLNNGFTIASGVLTLTTSNAPSEGAQLGFLYVI